MTLAEFKSWLDGFQEALGDAPTPEQWQKVLAKLETVQALHIPSTLGIGSGPLVASPSPPPVWCGPNTSTTSSQAVVNGYPVGPSY